VRNKLNESEVEEETAKKGASEARKCGIAFSSLIAV
jgi:hypothetical protein